jgi:sigma-B regulation protein RsbU (phosphoserine phosphatase)
VISNTNGERFITVFLAKYNEKTRRLKYINAGHNAPILFWQGKATKLISGTTMIGALDELPFINPGTVDIEPGSLIVNYTDGLLDHQNQGPKNWTEDDLIQFIIANGNEHPEKFNQLLMDYIDFVIKGKPIDDVTLLTLQIF